MKNEILPKVKIELDCIPKNLKELKQNIHQFFNVCNEVINNKNCFYTNEEIKIIKNNKEMQEQLNIKFL